MWSGSPSAVDLTPSGFLFSQAYGVSDGKQVGYGAVSDIAAHALLWSSSATNYVDLHPSGYQSSAAIGISGSTQVGLGVKWYTGPAYALMWSGTAASYLDLQTSLPSDYSSSRAYGIDSSGDIVGFASGSQGTQAVLWKYEPTVVPLPGAMLLGSLGMSFASWMPYQRRKAQEPR